MVVQRLACPCVPKASTCSAYCVGHGTTNGGSVDMTGFNACTFYLLVGSVVEQSSDDGIGDAFSDLEGTAVTLIEAGRSASDP